MNLQLYFNEVFIDNMILRTEFLSKRLLKQDIKVLLLTHYSDENLEFRKRLRITKYEENATIKIDSNVDLYCSCYNGKYNLRIGMGKIIGIDPKKGILVKPMMIYVDNKNTDNIKALFKILDSRIIGDVILKQHYNKDWLEFNKRYKEYKKKIESEKDKYINGLFKYYYDSMIQLLKDNNYYFSIGKMTAMSCYIVAKKFFKNKGMNVSLPNVFIRNFNVEFDMLILKKTTNRNKFVFEIDEVEAIVELKSNRLIGYGNADKYGNMYDYKNKLVIDNKKMIPNRWFKSYITFDDKYESMKNKVEKIDNSSKTGNTLSDNVVINSYMDMKKNINKKKFIYFCLYEKNSINIATYENTYFDMILAGKNYCGIYFVITDERDGYVIPIDYDIDLVLK